MVAVADLPRRRIWRLDLTRRALYRIRYRIYTVSAMGTRSKVYLPKWMRWFISPLLLVGWALVTYQAFGTTAGRDELGVIGWLAITVILVLIGGVVWMMTSGRLPAYVIEHERDDEQ